MCEGEEKLRKSILDQKKSQLVFQVFLSPAIEDYVTARWSIMNGLTRQFYWSASQVFEKLLKAVWIDLGWSTKSVSHNVKRLLDDIVSKVKSDALEAEFSCEFRETSGPRGALNPKEFVYQVGRFGRSDIRYDLHNSLTYPGDIHRFDETVFRIVSELGELGSLPSYGPFMLVQFEHSDLPENLKNTARQGNQLFGGKPTEVREIFRYRRHPLESLDANGLTAEAYKWLDELAQLPDIKSAGRIP